MIEKIRRDQADPLVRWQAERIVARLANKDVTSEMLAIYYWVLAHTRYGLDPALTEFVRGAVLQVEQIRRGVTPVVDCDDITVLICTLCGTLGMHARVVTVAFQNMMYRGETQYSHVFAAIQEPRTRVWVALDPVAGDQTPQMLGKVVAAKVWPVL